MVFDGYDRLTLLSDSFRVRTRRWLVAPTQDISDVAKNCVMRSLQSDLRHSVSADGGARVFRSFCKRYEIAEVTEHMLDMQFGRQVIAHGRDERVRISVRRITCQEVKDPFCQWIHQG